MKLIIYFIALFSPIFLSAQEYTDYVGAGHNIGMTISASHSMTDSEPENTFSGKGMDSKYFAASRFLSQATMGHTTTMVDDLLASDLDYDAWIEDQFTAPVTYTDPTMNAIWDEIIDWHIAQGDDPETIFGPYALHFNYAWWQNHMTNENDLLRQKVAYALTQIFVISENTDIGGWGEAMTGFYDMLLDHSFGNYRDMLYDVSLSIQMGFYLSHFNNAKANPVTGTSPDENYAREIMQLFSIGLYELNPDGTHMLDEDDKSIPTYDNDDIQEFAKIFTGLGVGELIDSTEWPYDPFFGLNIWAAKKNKPMHMYDEFHETSVKYLLNDSIVPANQTGLADIDMAIDNLFNHPNVGPFIGSLLIKRLVKSNPTPAYIGRITAVFNDNGSGVRGDMKAVIKAILMDEEARSGEGMLAPHAGRAKEPMVMYSSLSRVLPTTSPLGKYWNNGYNFFNNTNQHIFMAPTVFNFYLPNYQPVGPISDADMTAPEFKLHNTATSINWINRIYAWLAWDSALMNDWLPSNFPYSDVHLNQDDFMQYALQPEILVNELDKLLCYGQLSDETRDIIVNTLHDTYWTWNDDWQEERVSMAIYYIMLSPDYNTMK